MAWGVPQRPEAARPAQDIQTDRFLEVAASKEATAKSWLSHAAFLRQRPSDIQFFGQRGFKYPQSTQPYLIRTAYENGETGTFCLHRLGSALVVTDESLGATAVHPSARSWFVWILSLPRFAARSAGQSMRGHRLLTRGSRNSIDHQSDSPIRAERGKHLIRNASATASLRHGSEKLRESEPTAGSKPLTT